MKVSTMHWALLLGFLIVGTAAGFVLGNHYLDKRDEHRLAAQNLNE